MRLAFAGLPLAIELTAQRMSHFAWPLGRQGRGIEAPP
jgi:hypothetical protein